MGEPDQETPNKVGSAAIAAPESLARAPSPADETGADSALLLIEEEAHVGKREIVTGKVRVRTTVEAREELIRQELDTEHVTVTRVPVDRPVETAPPIRTEGDLTVIPVLEEVLVIEKKLVLREEIHIRRTSTTDIIEQPVSLRKQSAVIEHLPSNAAED